MSLLWLDDWLRLLSAYLLLTSIIFVNYIRVFSSDLSSFGDWSNLLVFTKTHGQVGKCICLSRVSLWLMLAYNFRKMVNVADAVFVR